MEDWLLFFHILGAAGWIGGGFFVYFMFPRLAREGDQVGARSIETITKSASMYFGITSGVLLLSGVGLVLTSDQYGWTDAFVLVGIGVFVLSGIWQSAVGKRSDAAIMGAAQGEGDVGAAIRRWRSMSAVDIGILLFAVWAMVVKLGA